MTDIHFDETGNLPLPNSMNQHLQMKLGKPSDIQKTPSRGGLGMIVNESKTPGARSLQGLASARKMTASTMKVPANIGFEIFEDEVEDEVVEKVQPVKQEIKERPCSPIDTVNRCSSFDSLAADICDDMLNMPDHDVVLFDEQPLSDFIDPQALEAEELAALGIEKWDEYPPIDPASRIAENDLDYPISPDEFPHECDVKLDEDLSYQNIYEDMNDLKMVDDDWKTKAERFLDMSDDVNVYDLLEEAYSIPL